MGNCFSWTSLPQECFGLRLVKETQSSAPVKETQSSAPKRWDSDIDQVANILRKDSESSLPLAEPPGRMNPLSQTVVVGIVGMSCSGKSTMAGKLATALNGRQVTVICQDDFFQFEQYHSDDCPRKDLRGHSWKDWETWRAIDFQSFAAAIRKAKDESKAPFLVVEGFQLCAHEATRALVDVLVVLHLPKDECWLRRKSRALSMRDLEPGLGDDKNYEVLDTYVFGEEGSEARSLARDSVLRAAKSSATCAQEGDEAWLRLYFEEMVWPEAERSREDVQCGKPMISIDASSPAGKEEWLAEWVPRASSFVREIVQQTPPAVA